MGKIIDLTGKQFGRLMVLEKDLSQKHKANTFWICQCKCGNIKSIRSSSLLNGSSKSCGCLARELLSQHSIKDMTGQKFGKLIVVSRSDYKPSIKESHVYWNCLCDCGNMTIVAGNNLRRGNVSSCGCMNSLGEWKIKNILQENNIKYKEQFTFDDLMGEERKLKFDFAIFNNKEELRFLIEYQGKQHYQRGWNDTEKEFTLYQEYDKKKKAYCLNHNIPLMIIPYTDYKILDYDYLVNKAKDIGVKQE